MIIVIEDKINKFIVTENELRKMIQFSIDSVLKSVENKKPKSIGFLLDEYDTLLNIEEMQEIVNNSITSQIKEMEMEITQ